MKKSFLGKIWAALMAHKIWTTAALVVVVVGGVYTYRTVKKADAAPQYMVGIVHNGNIEQVVTGSGQVSAENELDVTSKVSGEITGISVAVGERVTKGELLATIDPGNALSDLQSARIAYQKLVEPPKETDVSNAQNSLSKSYNDAYTAASSLFLDLPVVMTGLNDLYYSRTGFLSNQNSVILIPTIQANVSASVSSYDAVSNEYQAALRLYKTLDRNSATSSDNELLSESLTLAKNVSSALQNAQNSLTFVGTAEPQYNPSEGLTAAANVKAWSTSLNGDLSSLVSAQNTITSDNNSLTTLIQGADALDIESEQISLQQKESAYADYFIRAPFDGIVGRIPVKKYDQAGGSTVIATVVGDQKIATISLNEVDAAKVAVGQPVTITFDAIDNFTATGTVSEVDQVGTVTQGVVSYGVKISIGTTDPRVKPGMSLNATIITNQKQNVLVVPSAAVKTQGNFHYVQVLDLSGMASTTRRASNGGGAGRFASSTGTRNFGGGNAGGAGGAFGSGQMTVTSIAVPRNVPVQVGDSDDTNTEILSGLNPGQAVVIRTVTSSGTTSSAPSIFNSLGGNRGGTGARAGAAAGGAGRTIQFRGPGG